MSAQDYYNSGKPQDQPYVGGQPQGGYYPPQGGPPPQQGGYYPQQPQNSYQGQGGYGGPPPQGYQPYPQQGYQAQAPPQTVYV
ncbi:hypothetical protein D9611_012810 [Ephemerocybe angulata]|uniref:Uncharacterized protein n=2 Tax=Ephemerocybe angulata TaxID=980116 RepID=A0A8H6M3C7_9AGAR|nr:hypothetical protein D9611_012810 [Tulosesus angulatus]KAF6753050.1 hypothetical protein DFP72DRAFT_1069825 [Tulosesus angulatus]